ncbi:hypothetical protein KJA13_01465 [Patescibacteria group bacterium]|nr:hypothetical protein [Patescibacteria group bacterium]
MTDKNNKIEYPRGSEWRKWDLHIHTPVSGWDKKEILKTPQSEKEKREFCKKFIQNVQNKIDVIAITEHNDGSYIDSLLDEAKNLKSELVIFPGVEVISTEGIHMLVVFDKDKYIKKDQIKNWSDYISDFLARIKVPIKRFKNKQPQKSDMKAIEILEETNKYFGLVIFPHALSDQGVVNELRKDTLLGYATAQTKQQIYTHRLAGVLEIPDKIENLPKGYSGIVSGKDKNYKYKKVACINCSDARSFSKVGISGSYTWVKAIPTLEGLKQIIYEPEERVHIGLKDPRKFNYPILFKLKIDNCSKSFFFGKGLEVNLNPHFVTIIGGRGSGKSAFLDTLVLSLNRSEVLNRDNYINNYLKKKESLIIKADILSSSDGTEKSLSFRSLSSDEIIKEFPFEYYPQKEIGKLADPRSKTDLSKLIFQKIFEKKAKEEIKLIRKYNDDTLSDLGENREQIQKIERILKDEEILKKNLEESKKQIEFLQDKKIETLLEKRKNFIQIQNQYKEIKEKISDEIKIIKENLEVFQKNHFDYLFFQTEGNKNFLPKKWIQFEKSRLPQLLKNIFDGKEKLFTGLEILLQEIEKYIKYFDLEKEIKEISREIQKVVKTKSLSYSDKGVEDLQKKISDVETKLKKIEELKSRKQELIKERKKIRENYFLHLKEIRKKLEDVFGSFCNNEGKILNERIRIGFFLSTKNKECIKMIEKNHIVEDSFRGYFPREILLWVMENKGLNKVIEAFREGSFDSWRKWKKIGPQKVSYLNNIINKEGIAMRLEEILPTLSSGLKWRVAKNYKPLSECSIGERSTAVLSIILVSGETPLIIDQPEDDLDHSYIFKPLADIIKHVKKKRQLIFASHNANIVINGDAEQILIMEAEGGKHGKITISTIEDIEKRNKLLSILEGGRDAFDKREKKYGPANSQSKN